MIAVRYVISKEGITPNNLEIIETDYGIEKGEEAFNKFIKEPQPPHAILCGNDVLAAGALKQAKRLGIEVPREVSVAGFDDID